jgi:hypothetical protein
MNTTVTKFITLVKENIKPDFDINENIDIEIVKAGQYCHVNGRNESELAPAIEPSEHKLVELFGNNEMAFYIRIIAAI